MNKPVMEMMGAECVFPAPMVDEIERQKRLEKFRLSIWARGCVIDKEWRVRNTVFDKKDEKTTTKFKIRPARNEAEANFILSKLEVCNV